ncbi:uncharacterized protein LOC111284351 [Durio zibethinus]|uniref:Uncharacterized protein LOC111284351 n=1 Tax=Durio zibethinus TaxID=66656 RepID=A0A6P5XLI4_DURZI|nr:uncharacterized protein LOC111284351 [Durio zibethinus]
MAQLNAKAMHTLFCAIWPSEYNRVFLCENTKEIWDKLAITHEGTNQVKETKIGMLTHDYELFKMKPDETISEMSNRFTDIINGLKALEKTYSNMEIVKKILNSLPKSWKAKMTAIEEFKDPHTLFLDELTGSLITYEMKIRRGQEPIKKGGIALKSTFQKDEENFTQEEGDKDEEMAMFVKRFKKFIKMNKFSSRTKPQREMTKGASSRIERDQIICYECNKSGCIKLDCPLWKKQNMTKPKKKAMVVTWSDSDFFDDESNKGEVANLCLMGLDEPKVTSNPCDSNSYTFDELQDAYDELAIEFENMSMKYRKMSNPPSRKVFLDDDDIGILQEWINDAPHDIEENNQKEDDEFIEKLQHIEREPNHPKEMRLHNISEMVGDNEVITEENQQAK